MFEKEQFQVTDDSRKKFIGDIRYDNTDIPASLRPQALCIFIKLKTAFRNDSAYTGLRFLGITALFMQHTGNCGGGHLRQTCDINNIIFMLRGYLLSWRLKQDLNL